jgi:uncharacterized membrane protein
MQRALVWLLVGLAVTWACVIVAAPYAVEARAQGVRVVAAVAFVGAGHVCHQRPERSFQIGGHAMPVCARCAGLYLAAPLGLAGVLLMGRRGRADDRASRWWRIAIVAAAVPTVISVGLEWIAGPGLSCNISRAMTAAPLGGVLAAAIGAAVLGHARA